MNYFFMNGDKWSIWTVDQNDPMLVDRTNTLTVATTDPSTLTIYLSDRLRGDFLTNVLIHELGHCALYSFNLLEEIHRVVYPEYWIEAEEWLCNFIADFGIKIFDALKDIVGNTAWLYIPKELERWLS